MTWERLRPGVWLEWRGTLTVRSWWAGEWAQQLVGTSAVWGQWWAVYDWPDGALDWQPYMPYNCVIGPWTWIQQGSEPWAGRPHF